MAIAYVGNRGSQAAAADALTGLAHFTLTTEVLAGDLLVMSIASLGGLVAVDVNDSQGNVWQTDISRLNTCRVDVCSSVLANELRSGDTITVQLGLNVAYALNLEEFSGIVSPAWLDKTASNTGAGTALTSGTTATLSSGNFLLIGAWGINAAQASFTPVVNGDGTPTAFTIVNGATVTVVGEYQIPSGGSPAGKSLAGTAATTGTWAGAIAAYDGGTPRPELSGPAPFITR